MKIQLSRNLMRKGWMLLAATALAMVFLPNMAATLDATGRSARLRA